MHAGHEKTGHCKELLEQICDYIDGELETALCAELERHLAGCPDCRVIVDTTRKTISLYRQFTQPLDLPAGVTDRLWQALEQAGCRHSEE